MITNLKKTKAPYNHSHKLVPDPSNGGMSVALGDVTTSTAS